MGLYRQPNDWTCGPFALKHALVALGRLADEKAIAQVAHAHWWAGTDEVKLARAARHFGCDLPLIRRNKAENARAALERTVGQNRPALLCVDDWGHWITVVRHEGGRFVAIDSNESPVLQVMSWRQLRQRWLYESYNEEEDDYDHLYDFHQVRPRTRVPVKAHFSVERAQFLRRPQSASLAKHWDQYLGDLMEICRPRHGNGASLSMAEFLRRRQDMLLSRVRYWHGHIEREDVARVLRNFRFVAETYGLVIPVRESRRALVDIAMLLGMWAAASHGVGPMYGDSASDR